MEPETQASNTSAGKERVKVVSVSMYPSTKDLVLTYMDKQNIRSFSTAIEKIIVDHLGEM